VHAVLDSFGKPTPPTTTTGPTHIFNLGHGISQFTPPEHVAALVEAVQARCFTGLPPLAPAWRRLVDFAASYYQRSVGELALAVLPPELRKLDDAGLAKRLARLLQEAGRPRRRTHRPWRTPCS
jgi:hypothetical protein